jgi:hypothetical protein
METRRRGWVANAVLLVLPLLGTVVVPRPCAGGGASAAVRRAPVTATPTPAFPGRDDAYLISLAGALNSEDNRQQTELLGTMLKSDQQVEQQKQAEIAANLKRLTACCAIARNAQRCLLLRRDVEAFGRWHSACLAAMKRRHAGGGSLSPAEVRNVADGVAPGRRAALALAATIAREIAELPPTCR